MTECIWCGEPTDAGRYCSEACRQADAEAEEYCEREAEHEAAMRLEQDRQHAAAWREDDKASERADR